MKHYSGKIRYGLGILLILSPLGWLLPHWFHSGNAWGEWNSREISHHAGYVPDRMVKQEKIWTAPMSDYQITTGKENTVRSTAFYVLSAGVGVGIIVLGTWGLFIYYKRYES